MVIPVIPIIVAIILLALIWWVLTQFADKLWCGSWVC